SILSADFARLGEDVDKVLAAGADIVHFDVMDNHYVPNLTIGQMVCSALRKYGISAPIDVHLMVKPVDRIIGDFLEAGASYITFHPEASEHIDRSLQLIKSGGAKAGLVFNPATPLDCLKYVMDKVDMILLMSVNPGFGGQKFIPGTLAKLREARALIDASGLDSRLEPGAPPGDRRWGERTERPRHCRSRRRHLRGRLGDLRPARRRGSHRCQARRAGPGSAMTLLHELFGGSLPRRVMCDRDGA